MKRLVSFVLVIAFLVLTTATAYADNGIVQDDLTKTVNELLSANDLSKREIERCENLYGINDEVIACIYYLNPVGYVIVTSDNIISEYSMVNDFPYEEEKIYYCGPLEYYTKNEDAFVNVNSGEVINFKDMSEAMQSFKRINSEEVQVYSQYDSSFSLFAAGGSDNIPGTTRLYDYNPTGICGSTAAAIFLMYYRDYVDSFMVPSWHATADGISLIKLLEPNIDGTVPGSTTQDLVYGLNWYFRWRGISNQYNAVSKYLTNFGDYTRIIHSDRPVIIDLNAHPKYNEHWVVGHGYIIRGSDCYVDVNDGWGNSGIIINSTYVGYIVYLNR